MTPASSITGDLAFLAPGRIGRLTLKNRLIRAATSETMATPEGSPTEPLVTLYRDLAAGGAGLIITGHIFVEARGQYEPRQLGLHVDAHIPAFARVTEAVHANGGIIFAELSHAGSQSTLAAIEPIAPSVIANSISTRAPAEMSVGDIAGVIEAFAAAARRAVAAGFDGIHLHGGNGYLLAQFNSPHTNRRTDTWGGDAGRRSRFMFAVYRAVREAVGTHIPITARLGVQDAVEEGLTPQEGLERASQLAALGLDAIELTYGIMSSYRENIHPYAGNTRWHELADGIVHRLLAARVPEAYYRPFAKRLKQFVPIPVILVGGLRSTAMMDDVIRSGDADFVALARPFVRQPDLPNRIIAGQRGALDCVSCNLCVKHEGLDPLRCWRTPKMRLLSHLFSRSLPCFRRSCQGADQPLKHLAAQGRDVVGGAQRQHAALTRRPFQRGELAVHQTRGERMMIHTDEHSLERRVPIDVEKYELEIRYGGTQSVAIGLFEQYDTPAYRAHCRRLAQAIAPLIEQYLRRGDEVILIGLDGSPSTGVRFTSSKPDWGGRPNRPEDDWEIVPRRGVWIEELEAELARRGLPPLPATGWALDMGRFDEAGSRRDLEQFLDSRELAARSRDDGPAAP